MAAVGKMGHVDGRSSWPSEADYAWVEGWEGLGFCLALADCRPEDLLRTLVLHPATAVLPAPQARDWAWSENLPDYGAAIEASSTEGWGVALELNGHQATLAGPRARLSQATSAVIVYRGATDSTSFYWMVDSGVVRYFDPLLYDNRSFWEGPPLARRRDCRSASAPP